MTDRTTDNTAIIDATTTRNEILRVENLSLWIKKGADEIQILHNASFSIKDGERWGIAGESGAGKSMMMHTVAALLPNGSTRTEGAILYRLKDGSWQNLFDIPYAKRHEFVSKRVAFIFQDSIHALNPNERIRKQWAATAKLHHPGITDEECEEHLLERMDTFAIPGGMGTLGSYPHQLSGGMRQRIAIAMALESQSKAGAYEPSVRNGIIVADEPTTSLDSISQRSVVDYIEYICDKGGKTLLYVSHNLGILQHLCDNLMVMKDGVIIEQGRADDLFFRARESYTKAIVRETLNVMGKTSGGMS